eukprot:255013-Pyramimonas_sp.AAC.1
MCIRNHFARWSEQLGGHGQRRTAALATFDELCSARRSEFFDQWIKGRSRRRRSRSGECSSQ